MSDEPDNYNWLKQLLKALGILVAVVLLIILLGFGLLVGICKFGR